MKNLDIIVLDFGSQYTQLIVKALREENIYSEVFPYFKALEEIKNKKPKGIILSGGPSSVYNKDALKIDKCIYDLKIPILGICYGMQLLTAEFGGTVKRSDKQEYGKAKLILKKNDKKLLKNCKNMKTIWMSHSDKVIKLPKDFEVLASSENSPYAIIANEKKSIYAIQFHPEVKHSKQGKLLLKNFAKQICKIKNKYNMKNFLKEEIKKIKNEVKGNKVLCALSGGVDSLVTASIINKAIGKNLIPVFIDNGLLRNNESKRVKELCKNILKIPLINIDASKIFLDRLKNVSDPEKKRKIIGNTFIELFEAEAIKHKNIKYLAQGTLYSDIIESSSLNGPSKTIKSHHNVGGLPSKMIFKLIEPLKELFKDEVRKLGMELKIPKEHLFKHPFPGPGLAIRIMGKVNKKDLNILRKADDILMEELKQSNYYYKTWQAFAVLLNVRSVGVMGDKRTYNNSICIRIVDTDDAMTATFSKVAHKVLESISRRIINEVENVNRVVYDISSKPPATIEWE